MKQHNDHAYQGYSNRHAPWELETYLAFRDAKEAEGFEQYLKSNSGKAFMRSGLSRMNLRKPWWSLIMAARH
jgi:predicted GIY-YIG superfamily endonuclease